MSNTEIWDALGKTDPGATKGFNRSGGFKGTAVKPMWVLRRLTEQFGPAGKGWGVGKPDFTLVHAEGGEVLVFCTVSAWHGTKDNVLHGVGGDKAVAMRSGKLFADDEAFKKAYTDAVGNAFKSIGVAADIHMGLFDDDKYVAAMEREFAEPTPTGPISDATRAWLADKIDVRQIPPGEVCKAFNVTGLNAITYEQLDEVKAWLRDHQKAA